MLDSQSKIYDLAKAQFDAGYADHLTLLDAQRNLLSAKLNAVDAKLSLDNAAIGVYKALGGGFKQPQAE